MAAAKPTLDIWAIGIMFYAMLYGELPFNDKNEKKLKNMILNENIRFPASVPVTDMAK